MKPVAKVGPDLRTGLVCQTHAKPPVRKPDATHTCQPD